MWHDGAALCSESVYTCTYSVSGVPVRDQPLSDLGCWCSGEHGRRTDADERSRSYGNRQPRTRWQLVFDVDEASLVPGQNMDIFPGKIFRRQSGVTGTAINGLKFPNTAPENIQMYQISRQLADEETGLPSIMHGQTGVSGTGRTASGLSMLLGGASLSLKTVIKNIDDQLLKPLVEAYFQLNMQFNTDAPTIEGDLEIKPRGVAAVMQKEVRSQRLTTLLQTVSNPMLAPFIKIPNLMRELAIAQDIDPDSLVNDMSEHRFSRDVEGISQCSTEASQQGQPTGDQQGGMGQSGGVPREQIQMTLRALVAAQSELEVFRLQKITSLEQIKGLKADYEAAVKSKNGE